MKKYYDFSKLTRQQIKDKVIEIWKTGTTRDSRLVVNEAIRNGVSYNELCEYKNKRIKIEREEYEINRCR